jgi:hypothetical protein
MCIAERETGRSFDRCERRQHDPRIHRERLSVDETAGCVLRVASGVPIDFGRLFTRASEAATSRTNSDASWTWLP